MGLKQEMSGDRFRQIEKSIRNIGYFAFRTAKFVAPGLLLLIAYSGYEFMDQSDREHSLGVHIDQRVTQRFEVPVTQNRNRYAVAERWVFEDHIKTRVYPYKEKEEILSIWVEQTMKGGEKFKIKERICQIYQAAHCKDALEKAKSDWQAVTTYRNQLVYFNNLPS